MLLLAKFSVVGAGSIPTVNCEIVLLEPEPEPGEVGLGLEVAHAASAKLPSSKAPNAEESFLELGRIARPSRHQQIRLVATEVGPRRLASRRKRRTRNRARHTWPELTASCAPPRRKLTVASAYRSGRT